MLDSVMVVVVVVVVVVEMVAMSEEVMCHTHVCVCLGWLNRCKGTPGLS